MRKYTLYEILDTKKCQKMIEKAEYPINEEFLFAILEKYYGKYDSGEDEDLYNFEDVENAIEDLNKGKYYCYSSEYDYFDHLDELVEFRDGDWREQYFDYDSFHEDNMGNTETASNGVIIEYY